MFRYKLHIFDVGGQKSIRSYWRNYFEQTDGVIWVVDSADRMRLEDCKKELHSLLLEEVSTLFIVSALILFHIRILMIYLLSAIVGCVFTSVC